MSSPASPNSARSQPSSAASSSSALQLPRLDAAHRRPGRRRALRRRRRDGPSRGRRRCGSRGRLRRPSGAPRDRAHAAGAAARPGRRRGARREERADAALGAVRGLRRAHPRCIWRTTRSRSARTSSPAASCRRWSCSTRSRGGCPARSARAPGEEESFSAELEGGLEYPHYTRPAEFRGWRVPDVLLSGDHARIADWRREQSQRAHACREKPGRQADLTGCRVPGASRSTGSSRSSVPSRSSWRSRRGS